MNETADYCLVRACQGADPGGADAPFRALHDRHRSFVKNICRRVTGNGTDMLDAAQETFLSAFLRVREFRFQSPFSSWLRPIAVHASIDQRRSRAAQRKDESISDLDGLISGSVPAHPTPLGTAVRREFQACTRKAIHRLAPHLQEVLLLRYFEGLSYGELESTLGVSPGTIRSRLHRAHAAMAWELRALAGEGATE